jgi:hypothetical protein
LQTDPILFDGGMNLYAYVGNDPVNGSDPSGLADNVTVIVNSMRTENCLFDFTCRSSWDPRDIPSQSHLPSDNPDGGAGGGGGEIVVTGQRPRGSASNEIVVMGTRGVRWPMNGAVSANRGLWIEVQANDNVPPPRFPPDTEACYQGFAYCQKHAEALYDRGRVTDSREYLGACKAALYACRQVSENVQNMQPPFTGAIFGFRVHGIEYGVIQMKKGVPDKFYPGGVSQ